VIEVENGAITPRGQFDAHRQSSPVDYAVLYDDDGSVTARFDVRGYPSALIVGRGGKVVWHGFPTQDPAAVEAALDRALAK
jgi:hypothetical protein